MPSHWKVGDPLVGAAGAQSLKKTPRCRLSTPQQVALAWYVPTPGLFFLGRSLQNLLFHRRDQQAAQTAQERKPPLIHLCPAPSACNECLDVHRLRLAQAVLLRHM